MKKIMSRRYVRRQPVTSGYTAAVPVTARPPAWAANCEDLSQPAPKELPAPPAAAQSTHDAVQAQEAFRPDPYLAELQAAFVRRFGGWVSPRNRLEDLKVLTALELACDETVGRHHV